MRIHPTSILLGLGAAFIIPLFARVFRPLAVEAAVAGMGMVQEGRRILAEQLEMLEDIVAEARARREELLTEGDGHQAEGVEEPSEAPEEPEPVGPRRRTNGGRRRTA